MVFMKAAGNELARTMSQSHWSQIMPYKGSTILYRMLGYYVVLPTVSFGNGSKRIYIQPRIYYLSAIIIETKPKR